MKNASGAVIDLFGGKTPANCGTAPIAIDRPRQSGFLISFRGKQNPKTRDKDGPKIKERREREGWIPIRSFTERALYSLQRVGSFAVDVERPAVTVSASRTPNSRFVGLFLCECSKNVENAACTTLNVCQMVRNHGKR